MTHVTHDSLATSSNTSKRSSANVSSAPSNLLQIMLSATSELLVCLDSQLNYLAFNESYKNAFNLVNEEDLGRPIANHFDPKIYADVLAPHFEKSLAGEEVCLERWIKTAARGMRYMEVAAAPFQNQSLSGLLVAFRDLTTQQQMEEELRQAHKMEAIGTIAGGIAHEFNNLLGIVIGNTELAMDETPTWSSPYKNLEEIRNASFRAKDVVRKLIGYSRKQKAKLMAVPPAPLIADVVQFLRSSLPSTVVIRNDLDPNCPKIQADPAQIHQIILLLARSIMQSMADNTGIMTIRLSCIDANSMRVANIEGIHNTPYVGLEIGRDDSEYSPMGIATDSLSPHSNANGGDDSRDTDLAVVRRIVRSHNGVLEIPTDPGSNHRRYVILFPVFDDSSELLENKPAPSNDKQLNILFIDDEPGMLVIGRRVLKSLGHHVTVERDPTEALEMLLRNTHAYDLIITDLTMPTLTGDKLAKQISKIRPDLPILMCTGHTHHLEAEQLAACGIKGVLSKPFTRDDLDVAISNALPAPLPSYGEDAST